jgi:hypothetical protein
MTKHLKRLMDTLPLPAGEPTPGKTYLADGWVYRDLPRLSFEMFDRLVSMIGEANIVWLTQADYGDSKRGQLLISPDGIQRLKDSRAEPAEPSP